MNPRLYGHSKSETDEAPVVSSWRRKRSDSKRKYVTVMMYDTVNMHKCPEPLEG